MEQASAAEVWDTPMCSKSQPIKRSRRLPGIKIRRGVKYFVHIMRRQRECSAWHVIPNFGKPITSSNKWQMKSIWDRRSVRPMSARILAKQESRSLIPILAEKVLRERDAITVVD